MHDAAAAQAPDRKLSPQSLTHFRASLPTLAETSLAIASALLLVLSFPDFDLWWMAWIALVPLLVAVTLTPKAGRGFLLGWLWGLIFFYGTCWWLTYPMIHYAHIGAPLAYLLLLLPIVFVALFPALFCAVLARIVSRFGPAVLFVAPFLWVSIELARYAVTSQLWSAIGYSQAFHFWLIQTAAWSGVYAVGFLIVLVNTSLACLLLRKTKWTVLISSMCGLVVIGLVLISNFPSVTRPSSFIGLLEKPTAVVVAVQPNVPMDTADEKTEHESTNRHLVFSAEGLRDWEQKDRLDNVNGRIADSDWAKDDSVQGRQAIPRLVVWPESPMNFSYSRDSQLRDAVATLARTNHTSVLLNSLEPAPNSGEHNSAILVNEEGRIVAQYDKIRLMPFGEYVPLPQWIPGASSVRGIVGDFTPGSKYTLMPLGDLRAGVFICIEAAHPGIARSFANEGADVLINISNDGYLGPTPVMRQHLSNAIFRAVENDRDVLRVTNSGISAYIDSRGRVMDSTPGFAPTVRVWTAGGKHEGTTFYTRHGDVFADLCALISLGIVAASFSTRRNLIKRRG